MTKSKSLLIMTVLIIIKSCDSTKCTEYYNNFIKGISNEGVITKGNNGATPKFISPKDQIVCRCDKKTEMEPIEVEVFSIKMASHFVRTSNAITEVVGDVACLREDYVDLLVDSKILKPCRSGQGFAQAYMIAPTNSQTRHMTDQISKIEYGLSKMVGQDIQFILDNKFNYILNDPIQIRLVESLSKGTLEEKKIYEEFKDKKLPITIQTVNAIIRDNDVIGTYGAGSYLMQHKCELRKEILRDLKSCTRSCIGKATMYKKELQGICGRSDECRVWSDDLTFKIMKASDIVD
jgi:hypothetical protein